MAWISSSMTTAGIDARSTVFDPSETISSSRYNRSPVDADVPIDLRTRCPQCSANGDHHRSGVVPVPRRLPIHRTHTDRFPDARFRSTGEHMPSTARRFPSVSMLYQSSAVRPTASPITRPLGPRLAGAPCSVRDYSTSIYRDKRLETTFK